MVEARFDEDRPEAEFDRCFGEVGQAAAVPLPEADAGLEVATEFGEVRQIEMGVDPRRRAGERGRTGACRVGMHGEWPWGDRRGERRAGSFEASGCEPRSLVARLSARTYPDAMPSVAASPHESNSHPIAGRDRLAAFGIAAAAFAPLAVAAWLEPSGSGFGTHEQLGLPACGWIAGLGMPCPSCGMTTSFAFAARGDFAAAFAAQPMGALLAICAALVAVVAGWTALSGSRSWEVLWSAMGRRFWWGFVGVAALAWVYKIAAMRIDSMALPLASGGGAGG